MPHVEILDEQESWRNPVLSSIALHVAVLAGAAGWALYSSAHSESWGSANTLGGGSVAINTVATIPLPERRGQKNPVANETESLVPPPPPKPKPMKRTP